MINLTIFYVDSAAVEHIRVGTMVLTIIIIIIIIIIQIFY